MDAEPGAEDDTDRDPKDVAFGFVYLVKSGRHYTVGKTNSVGRRMSEHHRKLPEEPKLVHEIKTDDPQGVERYWLDRFADRKVRGDFFNLSREDVAAFKRWRRIF